MKLTNKAVLTGVRPSTPTNLFTVTIAGVVPAAVMRRYAFCCTVAAIEVGIAPHPKPQSNATAMVSTVPGRRRETPTYAQTELNVNVINVVILKGIFVPRLDKKLE